MFCVPVAFLPQEPSTSMALWDFNVRYSISHGARSRVYGPRSVFIRPSALNNEAILILPRSSRLIRGDVGVPTQSSFRGCCTRGDREAAKRQNPIRNKKSVQLAQYRGRMESSGRHEARVCGSKISAGVQSDKRVATVAEKGSSATTPKGWPLSPWIYSATTVPAEAHGWKNGGRRMKPLASACIEGSMQADILDYLISLLGNNSFRGRHSKLTPNAGVFNLLVWATVYRNSKVCYVLFSGE